MIIIGKGRIGGALLERSISRNVEVHMITRESGWSVLEQDTRPIFVTVRTTDLPAVFERVPHARLQDLVLCQNGMLTPWLEQQQLEMVTRGVLYMAVPARGAPMQLADPSPFTGPHAAAIVEWFQALNLPVVQTTTQSFQKIEVEKLLWNCVFGLLCQVTQKSVGVLCATEAQTIANMTQELLMVAEADRGVRLDMAPVLQGMLAYSATIPDYVGRVSDWAFRNGWFVGAASACGIDMPTHAQWASRL